MSDEEQPAEPRAGDQLDRVVSPALMDAVEKLCTRIVFQPYSLPTFAREPRLHVEPRDWLAIVVEQRERGNFSNQYYNDLRERAPQANLRDLYRPVMESRWHEREPRGDERDPGARKAAAEVRAARKREPLPSIEPSVRAVVAAQRARRAFLAERWQPTKPDDAPRDAIEAV